jgi:Retroviral aspartyl protease
MMIEQEKAKKLEPEQGEHCEMEEGEVEEAVISMFAISGNPYLSIMRFRGRIGNKKNCALLDSGSTHSFVNPSVLYGLNYIVIETELMVVMLAEGTRVVTDSKCVNLKYSLQGHEFCDDVRVLGIKSYDMILGIDWLRQHRPMNIDWLEQWVSFQYKGKVVKLEVRKELAHISMCERVQIDKELRNGHEVVIAHVMVMQSEKGTHNVVHSPLSETLKQFQKVFEEPKGLPPQRSADHQIVLKPQTTPVNQKPYRYSYYQKLELDKIIEELLKNGVIDCDSNCHEKWRAGA